MSHTMLYRCPGAHQIHGGNYDYLIVADEDVSATLAAGWFKSTPEAKDAYEDAMTPKVHSGKPTRDELEQKATELGIPFSAKVSDKKLGDLIEAKLVG